MKQRTNIKSTTPWEPIRGYSRAVLVDDHLYISGTTSVDDRGEVLFPSQPYEQTKYVIDRISRILKTQGFSPNDVVRTRMYVTNLNRWDDYAAAHREFFDRIRPASSIVQVARLTDPRLMVEMEVDAIKGLSEPITVEF
jgi:enamine deaminase RidA (YjgF/YER057c/UK114 family)